MRTAARLAAAALALVACVACSRERPATAEAPGRIRLATTTSARDSGLLDALLPVYEKAAGAKVDVIAVGTGAAFKLARDGNADLLLVHDEKSEEEFIAAGDGRERRPFCWNTFEILGPPADPAGAKGSADAATALRKISDARARFVSRGDDSGTHKRELSLWKAAGGLTKWEGYKETGQGMGPTLTVAEELSAYVLADRGTALRFRTKLHLAPFVSGTKDLRNVYSVVLLDEKRHPEVAGPSAQRLADWLTGPEAARRIEEYRVDGEPLFQPLRGER
jgi:tungstate transport system substrate-binding protein